MNVTIDPSEFEGVIERAVEVAIQRVEGRRPRDEAGRVLWDKRTAAKAMGVSVPTLDRLRKRGLPAVKIDGKVLFRPASLDHWAAKNESSQQRGG